MSDWTRRRFLEALPALPLAGASLAAAPAPPRLRAGAAKANITLPLGANNGGVILRGEPAAASTMSSTPAAWCSTMGSPAWPW